MAREKTLGEAIRQARTESEMSQTRLGELSGIKQSRVSAIELGKTAPIKTEVDGLIDVFPALEPYRIINVAEAPSCLPSSGDGVLGRLEAMADEISRLGTSDAVDAAVERIIEAGLWIRRHLEKSA